MGLTRYWGLVRSLVVYYRPPKRKQWVRFYRKLFSENALVFDIGAHVGSRTRFMRSAGARVVALEPQQPFAKFLRRFLPADVEFIEAAAGANETEAEMAVSSLNPTVSSLKTDFVSSANDSPGFERVNWDKKQKVKVTTLDALIESFGTPDYIKIDVEGYELEVLKGLTNPVKLLSIEFLPSLPSLTEAVLQRLVSLGEYEFNITHGEKAEFKWENWQNLTELKSWMSGQPAKAKPSDIFARLIGEN